MSFKIGQFFAFGDVEHFDLSTAVANGDSVVIAERHRADIVVELGGLVEAGDFRGAPRPQVQ